MFVLGRMPQSLTQITQYQFDSENVEIFNSDPSTDPDIVSVGGWWREYDVESQEWFGPFFTAYIAIASTFKKC